MASSSSSTGDPVISAAELELRRVVRLGIVHEFKRITTTHPSLLQDDRIRLSPDPILHVAARHGRKHMVEAILQSSPSLLTETNSRGNTPLHAAAAAGHAGVARSLLGHAKNDDVLVERMLSATNLAGNTALHKAAENGHDLVAEVLVRAMGTNGDLVLIENENRESLLSLAVVAGSAKMVRTIVDANPSSLRHRGPHNETPLHKAILKKDSAIFDVILRRNPEGPRLIHEKDINGRNAIHYATALAKPYDPKIKKLLKYEESSVCLVDTDNNNMTPLHMAVECNKLDVVRDFHERCPNSIHVTDVLGRNVLHVAAENGYLGIVMFLMGLPEVEELIDARDADRNTPLHLAARNCHTKILETLSKHPRIDLWARNTNGETAMDIVHEFEVTLPRNLGEMRTDIFNKLGEDLGREPTKKAENALKDGVLNQAQNLEEILKAKHYYTRKQPIHNKNLEYSAFVFLLATLVATVTFGAALQIPGGYRDNGTPVLAKVSSEGLFRFCIYDSLAVTMSLCAITTAWWSVLRPDNRSFDHNIRVAMSWTSASFALMGLAFLTALILTSREDSKVVVPVFVVGVVPLVLLRIRPLDVKD